MSFGNGESPGGTPGVMQGGDDGQQCGGIEGHGAQHNHGFRGIDLAEQDCEQRQDLGASACFAVDTGAEITHAQTDVEKRSNDENAQVATKNQDRDAPWHQPLMHEHQEQGAEQELVGHGIEILADLGMLLEHSCGQAIEAVAESGDNEETKRSLVMGLENRYDQKGYKAQAQESKQVGSCA